MLSTENPPPDLQCPCEISQLKSSNDERSSDDNQHKQLEVDLFKSGLDDSNPLPKFSIRDYVFNTRSKDVKNNWPFSLKNLQLCLKHGVKDVLPPFQSLDSVRNPLIAAKCAVDESEVSDHTIDQKLSEDTKNIDSSGSEEDKVFPSTTTSQSCLDKNPNLEPEAEYLLGSLSKKLEFGVRASNKVKSNTQNPVKKCKLILKIKNIAEPKVTEDLSVNNSVVSDTMATKVCPVCKTFSSSSNTTLNAHIDQCLSGESSVKWTTNSKAIKHRIKPRKSRLMEDIYETALPCTLEDLDKRNGTNWALNLGFPDQDLETYAEEKKKPDDQEGSVYIDSNGTKLRILSKLSDPVPNANAPGTTKLGKRDKGNKLLASKKKKLDAQKHKIMRSPPHAHRSSLRYHLEVDGDQQKNFPPEDYEDDCMQPVVAHDRTKSDDMGMIKQWVGSKRSGHKKKINLECENRRPDNNIVKNSVKIVPSSLEERNSSSMSPISYDENPPIPTESNKRKANLLCDSRDGCSELPCQKNKQGFCYRDCDDEGHHQFFSKPNVKQSRKDNPMLYESATDLPNGTENHVFSQRNKKMVVNINPTVNVKSSLISSRSLKHDIASGSKKFSSTKKKLLSARHSSDPVSKKKLGRKHLGLKNPKMHCTPRSEEEMIQSGTEFCGRKNLVGKLGGNAAQSKKASAKSLNGARVSKIQKKRAEFTSTSKGDMSLNSSDISPESDSHLDKNDNSFGGGNDPVGISNALEKDKMHDEFSYEPTYKIANGETFASFSKSIETAFPVLDYPSDSGYASQQYNEAYEGHCLAEPALGGEQEGFSADKIGNDLITSSGGHVDDNEVQGNYFVDVDPILIPGPPGSFLPSPGRMSSEELQGNSSLTACMIQSSENEHEAVNMDSSSDSPISAASVVSDSIATRSNSVSVNLPEESHNDIRCEISRGGVEPVGERPTSIEPAITADRKSNLPETKPKSTLPEMTTGHKFKSTPPCCCLRKDGTLLGNSLINQDSQYVRQQTITPRSVLAQEKKISCDPIEKVQPFNLRSETLPAKELTPEPRKFMSNPSIGCAPVLVPHHPETKFLIHGDCESPSPSTSNPVLRLMGKNLMIVNKDENLSPHAWPTRSSMVINHPGPRLRVDDSLSTGKNQDLLYSFPRTIPQGPSIFVNMPAGSPSQSFDFNHFDGFKAPAAIRPLRSSVHPSGVVFPNKNFGRSFIPSLKRTVQPDAPAAYDIEGIRSPAVDSSGSKHKEIIVIDDSPENEPNLASPELNRNMKFGESSEPTGLHVNPFYTSRTRGYHSLHTGSPVVQNGNTQVPSALYFSPGFS